MTFTSYAQRKYEQAEQARALALTQSVGYDATQSAVCPGCQPIKTALKRVAANTFSYQHCPRCKAQYATICG